MVFRRKARKARRFASPARKARRYASRAGVGKFSNLIQIDSMAYGVVRPKMENIVSPMVSMLPFGAANEEIALGLALWAGSKYLPGMLKGVAHKGLTIENYRIGEIVGAKIMPSTTTNTASSGSMLG